MDDLLLMLLLGAIAVVEDGQCSGKKLIVSFQRYDAAECPRGISRALS